MLKTQHPAWAQRLLSRAGFKSTAEVTDSCFKRGNRKQEKVEPEYFHSIPSNMSNGNPFRKGGPVRSYCPDSGDLVVTGTSMDNTPTLPFESLSTRYDRYLDWLENGPAWEDSSLWDKSLGHANRFGFHDGEGGSTMSMPTPNYDYM